jgi:predicted nucleotidyltransferase
MSQQEIVYDFIYSWADPATMKVFLFGSRVKWDAHDRSDRDIGILRKDGAKLDFATYVHIKWLAYDLPYKVDVVDFARAEPQFRQLASKYQQIIVE